MKGRCTGSLLMRDREERHGGMNCDMWCSFGSTTTLLVRKN